MLWEAVDAFDAYRKKNFKLQATLHYKRLSGIRYIIRLEYKGLWSLSFLCKFHLFI